MTLSDLRKSLPPPLRLTDVRRDIRRRNREAGVTVLAIDDDPTGTQTVHDVDVLMRWDTQALGNALSLEPNVLYLSTNSRGLASPSARDLAVEIGKNLRNLHPDADPYGSFAIASRSDSTLRGHFPAETDGLAEGLGAGPDGVILVPAFFEGGRYTAGDVHYVDMAGELIPAHETEFADDPDFGYSHSNLKDWVAEKTGGRHPADSVVSLSIEAIRTGGPSELSTLLKGVSDGAPVVANALCYEDLEVLVAGILDAEASGKRFIYRCAASFVKIRGGLDDRALLTAADLGAAAGAAGDRGPNAQGTPGMVVAGSYVKRTTEQLETLLEREAGRVAAIELATEQLFADGTRAEACDRAAAAADEALAAGRTPVLFTSREIHRSDSGDFLAAGKQIMDSLCTVIRSMRRQPSFLISKGGITSIEIARSALGVSRARVAGQIVKGVPVWRLGEDSRWPEIPYVVFPGNVGDFGALVEAFRSLSG